MATKRNQARSYNPVPSFLREMRERADLTQRDLAKAVRDQQGWVHRSETGSRRVDISEFIRWCRGCGVDLGKALLELAARM
jgi:transcriptional regulator with XRE-family HTH domain